MPFTHWGRDKMAAIFQTTFLNAFSWMNENIWISIEISVKFVPKGPINNIQALVQIMAWCRPGDKLLSETMLASLLMHICITRPQWIKSQYFMAVKISYFMPILLCQTSNLSHTKSPNLNMSCLVLQLSLPNPLKPGVKSRMKMKLEQHWLMMLQLHLSDQPF